MENLLRKYGWALTLALIGVGSILMALMANNLVASQLAPFTVPEPPEIADNSGPDRPTPTRTQRKGNWDRAIAQHCLFGCPDEQPADQCEGGCEEGEECRQGQCVEIDDSPQIPSDFPVASELNLKLLGAMVAKQPHYSMALVKNEDSSETLVASVGDYLMDNVELVEIRRDRIILRRQGQMEFVRMDKSITGNPTATPASTVRRSPSSSARRPQRSKPAPPPKDAIRKKGDGSFEVERSAIEKRIENRRELATQGRVVPNFKNGQRQGLKLVGITPNSVYTELGIQSGDVLHSVNGKQIKSSHQAMDFFESMKNDKTVKVQIERRGQKKNLEYNIR